MSGYWWIIVCFFSVCLGACHRPSAITFVQMEEVQLSRPGLRVNQVFFRDVATIYLNEPLPGCQIYYTDNGEVPDEKSQVAKDSIQLITTAKLRLKTIGGSYQPSEEVSLEVFRLKAQAAGIKCSAEPKAPYDQAEAAILIDQQKGSANFRDGKWLGYQAEQLSFDIELDGKTIAGLTLSVLEDQNSWIFAPDTVQVQFYDEADGLLAEGQMLYETASPKQGTTYRFLTIEVGEIQPTRATLTINNLNAIPNWHPGSGHTPWLFIDEILIR